MKQKTKVYIKIIISIVLVGALFVTASYLVQHNLFILKEISDRYFLRGILLYLIICIFNVVVAPLAVFPVLTFVSNVWGFKLAAAMSVVGWTLGSIIAFFIARKFGKKLIQKFTSLQQLKKIEKAIPKKNLFLNVVILRTLLPADVTSYSLGLFTKVDYKFFIGSTVIGVMPGAFAFAYLGVLPIAWQIILLIAGFLVFIWIIRYILNKMYEEEK